MFDHLTQITATQQHFRTEQEDFSYLYAVGAPPAQLEPLPQGLIEDQI